MSYIRTYTARNVSLVHTSHLDIHMLDIAHALSNINRFTGHTDQPYSVAQHSVIVSFLVRPELALEGLLHDATEAYLGDVSSPLKALLPDYKRLEYALGLTIRQRFGLPLMEHPEVKHYDLVALATERRDLLVCDGYWPILKGIEPMTSVINPWTHTEAKKMFIQRFNELTAHSPSNPFEYDGRSHLKS